MESKSQSAAQHFVNLYDAGVDVLAELEGQAAHHALDMARTRLRTALRTSKDTYDEVKVALMTATAAKDSGSGVVATLAMLALLLFSFAAPRSNAQILSQVQAQNNAVATTIANVSAGVLANPSGFNVTVTPGTLFCNGALAFAHNTQFTLSTNTGPWYVAYNCPSDQVTISLLPPSNSSVLFGTITCTATTCPTSTDNRSLIFFPNEVDESFYVAPSQCGGSVTGTTGTGNATDIVTAAGGQRVFRLSNTAAGASNNTFTCDFNVPTKLTAGKGFTITDYVLVVSTQTTQPTSVVLSTMKSYTPPAPVDPETASSATFVAAGGVITQAPTSAQFAAYAAVTAGQFYSLKQTLGTPELVNTDLKTYVVTFQFNQSAAAAGVQEVAGIVVHGKRVSN